MVVAGKGWNEAQMSGSPTETKLESVKHIGLAGPVVLGNRLANECSHEVDTDMCACDVAHA